MSLNTRWRPTDHDRAQSYTCPCHPGSNRHRQAPPRGAHRGAGHQRRRRLTILSTRADHDRLVETLTALRRPVVIGFEPTGNYHRSLAHRLIAAGFEARLISSMALARTREALHNGWDKNDPKDAQVILHMLRIGASTVYSDPVRSHERSAGAVEDPRHGLAGQDRAVASPADPLPAAVLSRDRAFPRQLSQRLVPGAARAVSDTGHHHRPVQGGVRGGRVGPGWPEGLQGTLAGRYLRDGAVVHGIAGTARFCRPSRCSGWFSPRAAA